MTPVIRADFRKGDEDGNFSVFRVWQFTERPGPHSLNASPLFTENPFFSLKSAL